MTFPKPHMRRWTGVPSPAAIVLIFTAALTPAIAATDSRASRLQRREAEEMEAYNLRIQQVSLMLHRLQDKDPRKRADAVRRLMEIKDNLDEPEDPEQVVPGHHPMVVTITFPEDSPPCKLLLKS